MRLRSLVARALITAAAVAATSTFHPTRAAACSGLPLCNSAKAFPVGGEIPANQFLVQFWPAREFDGSTPDGGVAAPRLYRVSGDARVEVPFDLEAGLKVRPREILPAGTTLVLEADAPTCLPSGALHAEYTLTSPQAVPTVLGPLTASVMRKPLQVLTTSFCIGVVDATYADLTVGTTPETEPFGAAVQYQLILDGAPARRFVPSTRSTDPWDTSELGGAHARVYAVCGRSDSNSGTPETPVALGVHHAKMRVTFPDGTVRETAEIQFELRCDGPEPGSEDLGTGNGRPTPDAQIAGGSGCALARGAPGSGPEAIATPLLVAAALRLGRSRRRHSRLV
jgi:hypothetical protein